MEPGSSLLSQRPIFNYDHSLSGNKLHLPGQIWLSCQTCCGASGCFHSKPIQSSTDTSLHFFLLELLGYPSVSSSPHHLQLLIKSSFLLLYCNGGLSTVQDLQIHSLYSWDEYSETLFATQGRKITGAQTGHSEHI